MKKKNRNIFILSYSIHIEGWGIIREVKSFQVTIKEPSEKVIIAKRTLAAIVFVAVLW